jgi:uncharacterized membrane protein HdeD (DUF308 family)
MSKGIAWTVFIFGITHLVFGIIKFKMPLSEAVSAGFIGQLKEPEARRTAFWFLICGALLMLIGHIAVRAVAAGDHSLFKVIGAYALILSVISVATFPGSPLWALLLLSLLLIAAGYDWLS